MCSFQIFLSIKPIVALISFPPKSQAFIEICIYNESLVIKLHYKIMFETGLSMKSNSNF